MILINLGAPLFTWFTITTRFPLHSVPTPSHPPYPLPSPTSSLSPLANLCKLQIHTSTAAAAIVVWCPLLCKLRIIPRTVLSCLLREERGASGHRHPEARRGVPRRWWVGTVSQQCRCRCFFICRYQGIIKKMQYNWDSIFQIETKNIFLFFIIFIFSCF